MWKILDFLFNHKYTNVMLLLDSQLINLQYSSILKVDKKFTGREIGNKILPYFYYSSLIASALVYLFLLYFPVKLSQFLNVCMFLVTNIIFYYMPERGFFIAKCTYCTGGISNLVKSLMYRLTIHSSSGDGQEKSTSYMKVKFLKKAVSSTMGWIAQDLFFYTETYRLIYFYTYIVDIYAILCVGYAFITSTNSYNIEPVSIGFSNILPEVSKIDRKIKTMLILGIMIDSVLLFTSLTASQYLLEIQEQEATDEWEAKAAISHISLISVEKPVEKEQTFLDQSLSILSLIISTIVKYISLCLIFIAEPFFMIFSVPIRTNFENEKSESKRKIAAIGYIETSIRILSLLISQLLGGYVFTSTSMVVSYANAFFIISACLLAMYSYCGRVRNAKFCFFFLSISIALTSKFTNSVLFSKSLNESGMDKFISCFSLFTQSAINTIVGVICDYFNFKASSKLRIYTCFMVISFSISAFFQFVF